MARRGGLPARGVIRESALTLGGLVILLSIAIRGQLDPVAGVTIALTLLTAGPGAAGAERVIHRLEASRVAELLEGLEDDDDQGDGEPPRRRPPPSSRRRPGGDL